MHALTSIRAQAAASMISPEAQDLGLRLAKTGSLPRLRPPLSKRI